jgi:hypothetical protein
MRNDYSTQHTQSLKSSGQSLIIYNEGTYQLGFSISHLMSALPKDDLKAKGMNPFKCLKAKKKQT